MKIFVPFYLIVQALCISAIAIEYGLEDIWVTASTNKLTASHNKNEAVLWVFESHAKIQHFLVVGKRIYVLSDRTIYGLGYNGRTFKTVELSESEDPPKWLVYDAQKRLLAMYSHFEMGHVFDLDLVYKGMDKQEYHVMPLQ